MQVILREKIRKLGNLGELVNVKPGYARNFLIPGKKGMMATKANLARFEAERAELERLAQETLDGAQTRSNQLQALVISLSASAGEGGKLFGSIGTRDIADAITKAGVEVHKHEIRMPNGVIRQTGEYEISVHLHTDIDTPIKISITAE
ncbi:MAG: 50S ribosomal protein L9 [Gammaproteobacteria bacterium]|jgi:large subunit ribosomal protein L9|nr:50S ribosomal protein L9 [Gammaproteobacteria bacterium]